MSEKYKLTDSELEELEKLRVRKINKTNYQFTGDQKTFLEEYYYELSAKERLKYVKKLFPDFDNYESFSRFVYIWRKQGRIKTYLDD
jgi:hypothetical protein